MSLYEPRRIATELPHHEGVVVRPDALRAAATVRIEDVGGERAVGLLKLAFEHVAERVHAVSGAATVRPARFGSREISTKLKGAIEDAASVGLVVEVALAAGEDFWARARLVESLELALRSAALELVKRKPSVLLAVGGAVAFVRDPEQHGDALLERFMARARRAQELAGSVVVAPVVVPGEIVQTPETLDAVRLTFGARAATAPF